MCLAMVEEQIRGRGIKDERVIRAMFRVPRHQFVPDSYKDSAYADHPLPIGFGQTISQPYIVAFMTELLQLQGHEKVLEVGTGSGYQTAILAELASEVYSIEILEALSTRAQKTLKDLGYKNIHFIVDDGYVGWTEHAPYDGIIVTAAGECIPQPLIDQLGEAGRLVIPVGPSGGYQTLWQIVKKGGILKYNNHGGVVFVPLKRKPPE